MAKEIERKWLVVEDQWKHCVFVKKSDIIQGYLTTDLHLLTRVRIADHSKAFITIKSKQVGWVRDEFEYEIPLADAYALMNLCEDRVLAKTRYVIVDPSQQQWEIDVFHGKLDGLVIAEKELETDQDLVIEPSWLGTEVTTNLLYTNVNLCLTGIPPATQ